MNDSVNARAWLTGKSDNRRFALACVIGLAVEAGLLALLLPIMTHSLPPPSDKQSIIKLTILAPALPAPPAPPVPRPKPIVPTPRPVPPTPILPLPPPLPRAPPLTPPLVPPPAPVAPRHPVIHPLSLPRHMAQTTVQPPLVTQTLPSPTPPSPAAPAAPSAGELDRFQAEMRRAVQAAAVNPAAAQMANESGIVRVQFIYLNGVAGDIRVISSSGFPILDEAARAAVRNAAYPPQPPDMAGHPDQIVVDVVFRADAEDGD